MYLFIHNLRLKRLKNVMQRYDEDGISIRGHKLTNKASTNKDVITEVDKQNIVAFLKSYASRVAIPLLSQFRNYEKVVKWTSCNTKAAMYRKFVGAAKDDENIQYIFVKLIVPTS